MKLTNNSLGPKAITTTDRGVIVLQPGQSDDLNVGDDDMAAIKAANLLEAPEGGKVPSLADLQREIASSGLAAPAPAETATGDNLPAEDDAEVVELVDSTTATELQRIAKDEKVDMAGARTKLDAARRIVGKRRAAGPSQPEASGEGTLPAADDADVVALVNGNDEAALRQLATDENVKVTSDDDKADLARKLVAARRAK